MAMLEIQSLRKAFSGQGRQVEALKDISFRVEAGDFVCVVGPSGCGKTTLLKAIAGLLSPTSGSVSLQGRAVSGPTDGMAVVSQEYSRSLFPWYSVRRNIELPLMHLISSKAERRQTVDEALAAVGLEGAGSAYPWQLSGGMQQRVAIARAVAFKPLLLLMDEPFAAVDAQTRADLEDLTRSLWQTSGVTTLLVTHDIDEAVYLGQRVIVLSKSPTVVKDDIGIDLPVERDQAATRADPRFVELRTRILNQIRRTRESEAAGTGAS